MQTFPKDIRRFVLLFSSSKFFWYFNFFWLIQNIYFLDQGLTFQQLSIVISIWSIATVILEIPSGAFSDVYGRKITLIISKISYLFGILLFVFQPSFLGIVIGILCWALSESFMSGAEEAWLFEYVEQNGRPEVFQKAFSISVIAREVGLGTGVLIAGFVTSISISYNLIGSILIAVLGIIPVLLLPETRHSQSEVSPKEYLSLFRKSYKQIKGHPYLRYLLVFSTTTLLAYATISEYFTVTLDTLGIPFSLIGFFALLETFFYITGSQLAEKTNITHLNKIFTALSIGMASGMFLIVTGNAIIVVVSYLLLRTIKAISEILAYSEWQKTIEHIDRATSTSFVSFTINLVSVPVALLFGYVSDRYSLFSAFYFAGLLPLTFILTSSLIKIHSAKT